MDFLFRNETKFKWIICLQYNMNSRFRAHRVIIKHIQNLNLAKSYDTYNVNQNFRLGLLR
jgi:hypothetical protein